MTLALEFAAQNQNLTFAWTLPGIDKLEDPFVVVPSQPDTLYDMTLVSDGLRALTDDGATEVAQPAIEEALFMTLQARAASIAHTKTSTLDRLPNPNRPLPLGWGCYVGKEGLRNWWDEITSDVFHSAVPVYMEGAPAKAARLGLRALAERGATGCDPMKLAIIAGEVATKYSGTQHLTVREWVEAYRATVTERGEAQLRGDVEDVHRLERTLDWVVGHTVETLA
jgi:hypothetical protein